MVLFNFVVLFYRVPVASSRFKMSIASSSNMAADEEIAAETKERVAAWIEMISYYRNLNELERLSNVLFLVKCLVKNGLTTFKGTDPNVVCLAIEFTIGDLSRNDDEAIEKLIRETEGFYSRSERKGRWVEFRLVKETMIRLIKNAESSITKEYKTWREHEGVDNSELPDLKTLEQFFESLMYWVQHYMKTCG